MTWWLLLIVLMVIWLAWGAAGLLELKAQKLEGKRPPDAGFSIVPVFPLFPVVLFGIAKLIDVFVAPSGSLSIFWLHMALAAAIAVTIARDLFRIRAARALLRDTKSDSH